MKVKTSELQGAALDWAVAKCEGKGIEFDDPSDPWLTRGGIADQPLHSYTPSTDWAQGGPIIEREELLLSCNWQRPYALKVFVDEKRVVQSNGPTPLIAAMRCYVASKLGEEIDVPNELTGE
jgi:hypothetical protein